MLDGIDGTCHTFNCPRALSSLKKCNNMTLRLGGEGAGEAERFWRVCLCFFLDLDREMINPEIISVTSTSSATLQCTPFMLLIFQRFSRIRQKMRSARARARTDTIAHTHTRTHATHPLFIYALLPIAAAIASSPAVSVAAIPTGVCLLQHMLLCVGFGGLCAICSVSRCRCWSVA